MVRVVSLLWTLIASLAITALSFYYTSNIGGETRHGYPFSFATEKVNDLGEVNLKINYVSIVIDAVIWWFLFSILWIMFRNYILEAD